MQKWVVPNTGTYFYHMRSMGGSQNSTYHGGYGAVVSGSVDLGRSNTIIAVGQKGGDDGTAQAVVGGSSH